MPDSSQPPRRSVALTARLVLGYSMAALVTLSAAAWLLHRGLLQSFKTEDAALLAGHVGRLREDVLRKPVDLHEATELLNVKVTPGQLEKYYGRLLDEHGRVLLLSPGVAEMPAPEVFPSPVPANEPLSTLKEWRSVTGTPYLIAAALVDRGPGYAPLLYQVALDATHVETWMQGYRRQLAVMVGLGTLASTLLAWLITRHGLAPLRAITSSVHNVTAFGPDEHLSTRSWPAELSVLAVEFDRMLARLRDSFQRLSQFTADAAHEFRTPLNNLIGATTLALSRDRTPDEYRRTLEIHLEEYERLTRMMESLLFLARAEHAAASLRKQPVDAAALSRAVAEFFSALADENGVTLTVRGEAMIEGDETLFRHALSNLVSNALRHSPRGGTVAIDLKGGGRAKTIITVSDTGPGIAAEHLPRLFDRFYRAEESRSAAGSGLGLAIVKTVMALHGGDVSVSSQPGTGTTFTLQFPGATEPPGKTPAPMATSIPARNENVNPVSR